MAIGLTDDKHYQAIAQALRDNAVTTKSYMPGEMAEEIYTIAPRHYEIGRQEGYEAGKAEGGDADEAYEQGVADGKQAEYDRFWDEFQQNGERTKYRYAFAGWVGIPEIKYPITPISTNADYMFSNFNIATPLNERPDLTELCKKVDFSQVTTANYLFQNARATHITIDLSNCTRAAHAFNCNNAGGMDDLTIKVTEKLKSADSFFAYSGENSFHNVRFTEDSVIEFSLTMQRLANLNLESICSVVKALSPNTSGLSLSLSKATVAAAFETTEEDIAKNAQWLELTGPKENWTISLI